MSDIGDYLERRRDQLGMERADQLAAIQVYLDGLYPGQCRAASLNDGVLKITTPNASLASELRMRRTEILTQLPMVSSLVIHIR